MPTPSTNTANPTNPYTVTRLALNLSQPALAKLAGITDQYIRRLETGTVSGGNGAVIAATFKYASEWPALANRLTQQSNLAMQRLLSEAKSLDLKFNLMPLNLQSLPLYEFGFNQWYDAWVHTTRAKVTTDDIYQADSIYAICRALLLHPYSIQNYLKRKREGKVHTLPNELMVALSQAGISLVFFMEQLMDLDLHRPDNLEAHR